ncbi:MAG: acyl-CoA dehydrogenase family protein [Pseudomonadales bacterium]|nr:acyl-CoA dehydrogenase family protein [Pseudomonadales bacterium]
MDFNDTPQEAAFRAQARAFLDANASLKTETMAVQETEAELLVRAKAWQKLKAENNWACLNWPKEYGGRASTPMERIIWDQEEGLFDVPTGPFAIGLGMCGPTMIAYASEEQKREHLPLMASGEHIWCQLFSEPSAGSDLANLRTRAEPDGDEWIINGQKIWTSGGHYADWGILVTRSDPDVPKHKGLTFFFVNMHTPGIEIKPIKQINGAANFNEIYFTDARIPDSQRLGEVGEGWAVSITTLMNERLAVGNIMRGPDIPELIKLAENTEIDGKPAIANAAVREKIADWYCQSSGLNFTNYRTLSALSRGGVPGPENSITKVVRASKQQDLASFGLDLMDMGGILNENMDDEFLHTYLSSPGSRIAGGTDEILRNIIAERVLGLPQDIRIDKTVAFNEVPNSS